MRFAIHDRAPAGDDLRATSVAVAKRAEANGFEALFRSDHYASFPGRPGMPTTDAWAVLAGLARDTDRIGLGALVSPVTFRHPGNFAKVVTTVDEMSGGRIEVGVGAGWNDLEHRQLGLAFPPIKERADLLEDQLAILHGLWGEPDGWSYDGHHRARSPTPLPAEAGRRPGPAHGRRSAARGRGSSSAAAARRGPTGWRRATPTSTTSPRRRPGAGRAEVHADLDAACEAIGRDPGDAGPVGHDRRRSIGRDDAELKARGAAAARRVRPGRDAGEDWLAERELRWIIGTPDQARDTVRAFAAAGVERIMLQDFMPWDLDMIDVMGEALVGQI